MNPQTEKSVVAYTFWSRNSAPWYVADLPGCDGDQRNLTCPNSDWGYTTDAKKALRISPYWQRRFQSDSRKCGRTAHFYN